MVLSRTWSASRRWTPGGYGGKRRESQRLSAVDPACADCRTGVCDKSRGGMGGAIRVFLGRYFYFAMALLLAWIVWFGFSHTIEENLFHPSFARPKVLYVHAALFGGWMVLLIVQTGLVALARKRRWHRWLGWLGVAMACVMPVLGTWSAISMTHLRYGFG